MANLDDVLQEMRVDLGQPPWTVREASTYAVPAGTGVLLELVHSGTVQYQFWLPLSNGRLLSILAEDRASDDNVITSAEFRRVAKSVQVSE